MIKNSENESLLPLKLKQKRFAWLQIYPGLRIGM